MKKNVLTFFIVTVLCVSSYVRAQNNQKTEKQSVNFKVTDVQKDKEEIQKLIRQVLSWSESKETIDLLPVLADNKDSVYVGFNMDELKENIDKLKETGFFSAEFIENYNQIILTLDRKLRNKDYIKWFIGDLPPFKFANDINPWCLCQGYSSDDFYDIEINKLNCKSGEIMWKWENDSNWKNFRFRVIKENNKWKISYMEGFDYNESIRKDGEIKTN
jgi:hypothetical protein